MGHLLDFATTGRGWASSLHLLLRRNLESWHLVPDGCSTSAGPNIDPPKHSHYPCMLSYHFQIVVSNSYRFD